MRGVVGIILAGGASRRMGSDKALVEVGGRPMAGWVADAMAGFDRVVMVGRHRGVAGLEAIPDLQPGPAGPLNGLHTALTILRQPVVAVAVDQPLVRSGTLDRLAELAAANQTAVCVDERPQVTCAAYSPDCLDEAERILHSGGSMQQMLRSVPWTRVDREIWSSWGEDGRSWFSMDSPNDIVAAERRFRINLLG